MKNKKLLPFAAEVRFICDQLTNNEIDTDEEIIELLYNNTPYLHKDTIKKIVKRERNKCINQFNFPDLSELIGKENFTADYYSEEQERLYFKSIQE